MTNTTESGHAKNVANFENLISFCKGYEAAYNPSKENLKLLALNNLLASSQAGLQLVKSTKTNFDNATNVREIGFEPFKKLCTRIVNALEATDASTQTVDDAKTINRKIQGKRADNTPLSSERGVGGEVPIAIDNHISVSQQGIDNMIDHFSKFIQLLSAEPMYNPNETDLKVSELNNRLTNLKTYNSAAISAGTDYSNARIARDTILYGTNTGLVDIAWEVKKYVKSVYGTSSPQFKQISGLLFRSTQ
jgi:hypothetical protein